VYTRSTGQNRTENAEIGKKVHLTLTPLTVYKKKDISLVCMFYFETRKSVWHTVN
jgi:hypothetical protein